MSNREEIAHMHTNHVYMHFAALASRRCGSEKEIEAIQFNQIVFAKQDEAEIGFLSFYRFC